MTTLRKTMTTLRNEDTPEGKEMWRKVDEAASRAPQWMKDRISALVDRPYASPTQTEEKITDAKEQELK